MIVGVGTDIVEIARLRQSIERSGSHFLNHVFTQAEQQGAPSGEANLYAYYAGRWAAKEALSKALGTGIGGDCALREIIVSNDAAGKPSLALDGSAAQTAEHLGIRRLHLSISHERSYACAVVVAEGE